MRNIEILLLFFSMKEATLNFK